MRRMFREDVCPRVSMGFRSGGFATGAMIGWWITSYHKVTKPEILQ